MSVGLRRKQAKSNLIDGFLDYRGISDRSGFRIVKPIISSIWKSRVRGIPSEWEPSSIHEEVQGARWVVAEEATMVVELRESDGCRK